MSPRLKCFYLYDLMIVVFILLYFFVKMMSQKSISINNNKNISNIKNEFKNKK